MGAYHTIDVEPQRKFTLTKPDGWDSVALDRVDEACDAARTADLAAIVMQEGLANICLVTSSMTVQKQKVIEYLVPLIGVPCKKGSHTAFACSVVLSSFIFSDRCYRST